MIETSTIFITYSQLMETFTFRSIARAETPTERNAAKETIQEPIHASTIDAQTPNFWEKMVAHRIGATKNTTRHDLQQLLKTV